MRDNPSPNPNCDKKNEKRRNIMITRSRAVKELNEAISFIPRNALDDKNKTVGELLDEIESNGCGFTATEGEIAILLGDDPLCRLQAEITAMIEKYEKACENEISGKNRHYGIRKMLESKIDVCLKVTHIIGDMREKSASSAHISRTKISKAENVLRANGIPEDDIKAVIDSIFEELTGDSLYLNESRSISILIDPV